MCGCGMCRCADAQMKDLKVVEKVVIVIRVEEVKIKAVFLWTIDHGLLTKGCKG